MKQSALLLSTKPIAKIFLVFLTLLGVLTSCSEATKPAPANKRTGKGDVVYGGLLKMNITSETRSIFPHNIVDASAINIMGQVYEGLLRLDSETGEISNALADSLGVSDDGKVYTFHLRKGVYFHDDKIFPEGKGREVKAEDVAYCFTQLCTPAPYNQLYALVVDIIKNGRAYYESNGNEEVPIGIRVIDEYTLEIELEFRTPTFLSILTHPACWVFPKELYKYDSQIDSWCVGTGPFIPRTIKMNEVVILERNNHYWRADANGNSLPYLDAVRCNFIIDQKEQLDYFLDDHLDVLLSVPFAEVARLENMLVKNDNPNFKIISTPGIRVEYYGFLLTDEVLGDLRVRRAIFESIDRDFLVDSILLGYGVPADNGFIPPSMPGYNADSVQAWSYNPEEARQLFADAGFPEAKGFPVLTLQLNDGSKTILQVAEAVQSMITSNLGITVELSVLPKDAHYETIEMGNVRFWRDGWIGDYPDPENFLKLFHGKLVPDDNEKASYLNTVRFINEEFDLNFENSLKEPNTDLRMEQFYHADQIIVDQAAVIPLYYEKWIWLVKGNVKNVRGNGLGNLDLSTVYFSEPD